MLPIDITAAGLNAFQKGSLADYLGIEVLSTDRAGVAAKMAIKPHHMAPNGFAHAASIVALADTSCGYGCIANLPEGATGFTTIELKSNHLGTARSGDIECRATPAHLGRTTQVWDATVTAGGKTIALFRCTQMVLWPRP
ncbi:MAG: PaaI family thioesterase [Pseudomonadota bacterium]